MKIAEKDERRTISMRKSLFLSFGCLCLFIFPAANGSSGGEAPVPAISSSLVCGLTSERVAQVNSEQKKEGQSETQTEEKKKKPAKPAPADEKKGGQPDNQEDWQEYEEYETQC